MTKVSYCNQTQTVILKAEDETTTRFPMKNLMVAPITQKMEDFNRAIYTVLSHVHILIQESDGVLHFRPTEFSIRKEKLEKIIEGYSSNNTQQLFDAINNA